MPRRSFPAVDPVLSEIAKAIYGGDVDLRELGLISKDGTPGPSAVHVDSPARQKKVAQTGLLATGVAGVAGVHAIGATRSENSIRAAVARGEVPEEKAAGKAMKLIGRVAPKLKPSKAAAIIGGGALALHGVELVGDSLGAHAQVNALRAANAAQSAQPKKPVAKSITPKTLNLVARRPPSLRARRPSRNPLPAGPTSQAGLFRPIGKSSPAEVTWTGVISKVDTEQRQVFGWASVSNLNGQDVVDLQGDVVPIDEIEKSAYKYVLESRKGGDMHKRVSKFAADEPLHTADMIESFVVTPEKLEKMGLAPDALPHGWWIGFHVNDDQQWDDVKSGRRAGFSIHGSGTRTPTAMSKGDDRPRIKLKTRAGQAIHPPAPKLHDVESSAINAIGYQPQTRRLAVEMHSKVGTPYLYKVTPEQAKAAMDAKSLGHHYATQIRGKVPRSKGVGPAGRVRLFVHPQTKVSYGDRPKSTAGRAPVGTSYQKMGPTQMSKNLATEIVGAPVDVADVQSIVKPKKKTPRLPVAGQAKMVLKPLSNVTSSLSPPSFPISTPLTGAVTGP